MEGGVQKSVAEVLKEGAKGRKGMRREHGWHFQGLESGWAERT